MFIFRIIWVIFVAIVIFVSIKWIWRNFTGCLKFFLILVLILLALGLIAGGAPLKALGWFLFSAICLVLAGLIINLLR